MKNWPWYNVFIVGLVVLALFFFFFYKPKNAELKKIRDERIQTQAEVSHLRQKKMELDKIEVEIQQMRGTLNQLEEIIPRKRETSDILNQIQQLALDARLNITKFNPQKDITREFYIEWPILIEITGNYHNLGIFFDRLSRFARLFNVENFIVKALPKQTEASTIQASWTAKTYIVKEEAEAAEPAVKKPARRGK